MTIVVFDGTSLAADKAAICMGYATTVTKIYRVPGGLVGLAGDGDHAMRLLDWFRKGRDLATYPKDQAENDVSAVLIDHQRRIWSYGKTGFPQLCEDKVYAMGHGRDFALAALYLGCDARKSVEVTCALDALCGNGVDVLTFETMEENI